MGLVICANSPLCNLIRWTWSTLGDERDDFELTLLGALLFAGAALYASVGQAGATAFIAAMGVVGLPAATIRPEIRPDSTITLYHA